MAVCKLGDDNEERSSTSRFCRHNVVSNAKLGGLNHNVLNIIPFGRMLLSLLHCLVVQPTRRTLPGRYSNGNHEVVRRHGWFRLQRLDCEVVQWKECSTVDERPSRPDSKLLLHLYWSAVVGLVYII